MDNDKYTKYFQDIVMENKYRLNILKKHNLILLKEYRLYQYQMDRLAEDLYKTLSFSTNKIRRDFLKESYMNHNAQYHISKLRLDRYNGAKNETNHANDLYNILLNRKSNSAFLFCTIDYIHSPSNIDLDVYLNNIKHLMKSYTYTKQYTLLNGLFVKYEISFGMYKNKLCVTPHIHLIIDIDKNLIEDLILELKEYFKPILHEPNKDLNIQVVKDTEKDYYKLSRYICKDFYTSIFHNKDNSVTPYSHIIYTLLKTKNFRYINSYKSLKIKI